MLRREYSGKTKRAVGEGRGGGVGPKSSSPPPAKVAVMADRPDDFDVSRIPSAEEKKHAAFDAKFHPSVLAVIERLKDKKAAPGADEAKFIHNGKAEIQIWLNDKSDETMSALKAMGFEVVLDPKTAKMVIGRMPVEKLAALAELKAVRYVGLQM
jgi:hypothetical protein